MSPMLTVEMIEASEWLPVLSYPIPPKPSQELVAKGIEKLLNILEYQVSEAPRPPDIAELVSDINETTARLVLFAKHRTELQIPRAG